MPRKEELTDQFEVADADGHRQTLFVYTTFIEFRPVAGPSTWNPGSKRLATADGDHVNVNADGSFTELQSGRKLQRV